MCHPPPLPDPDCFPDLPTASETCSPHHCAQRWEGVLRAPPCHFQTIVTLHSFLEGTSVHHQSPVLLAVSVAVWVMGQLWAPLCLISFSRDPVLHPPPGRTLGFVITKNRAHRNPLLPQLSAAREFLLLTCQLTP